MVNRGRPKGAPNTYERCIDAGEELFARHGFDGASIRDIAGAVGITNGSVFNHFKSKERLYGAVFERLVASVTAYVSGAAMEPDLSSVVDFFDRFLSWCLEKPHYAQLLNRELMENHLRLVRAQTLHLGEPVSVVVDQIRTGQNLGVLRTCDAEVFTFYTLGAIAHFSVAVPTLGRLMNDDMGETRARFRTALLDHVVTALTVSPPGFCYAGADAFEAPSPAASRLGQGFPVDELTTRERCLIVAEALFARGGFAAMGMREMAKDCGISTAAVLHHFKSKDKLYGEVLDRLRESLSGYFAEMLFATDFECVVEYFERFMLWCFEKPHYSRLLLRELIESRDCAVKGRKFYFSSPVPLVIEKIRRGQSLGYFRALDAEMFTYYILGAATHFSASAPTIDRMLVEDMGSPQARFRRVLVNHIVSGLTPVAWAANPHGEWLPQAAALESGA
ncbi:hypothetical protein GCM10019059_35750 [Camelimonas fluminis]|uniref:TetR/AcrR family transcriptional regulator n=1 Tax=Camelimonas fluminis TaxID=1576911 RepID=A0ABV7UG32_9HYPH|nr:TetR/AcrR family transcriptional regulator [Camelimonas fluminis]GHE72994.1 hypothetical protein GCM10019059_35750 [Camelimonas fluminis]